MEWGKKRRGTKEKDMAKIRRLRNSTVGGREDETIDCDYVYIYFIMVVHGHQQTATSSRELYLCLRGQ